MNQWINIFILVPAAGFFLSLIIKDGKERILSRTAFYTAGVNLIALTIFSTAWIFQGAQGLNVPDLFLYKSPGYSVLLDFFFDKITAVYLLVGALLTFLITIYSRYYLHRETGYKRFFNTILFFYLGYNITVLSGNFETLFLGWEILGISSFLLIAFYRNRYLPSRNAVKVFSVYRIGDVGILLAMWASHHLWHENISFIDLQNRTMVHEHLLNHSLLGVFISLMLVVAAAAKSAQLPFTYWLPRAMEGPTPSSAIFYGSLSVHFGVFLLLRTHPFWENQISVRILIALLGISTSIVATLIAQVQSSIKSQVAYASAAQIGLIFIEISLGFENLALLHFAGNAFLRTYQLLVSPSLVSYLIREQFYNFEPHTEKTRIHLHGKLQNTLYILSLREFNLDQIMNRFVFRPLKNMGKQLNFLHMKNILLYFIPVYAAGIFFLFHRNNIPAELNHWLPQIFSGIGLIMVLKSFSERQEPKLSWILVILYHFWAALAISFNETFNIEHVMLYLSGVVVFGTIGFVFLNKLQSNVGPDFNLNRYYGHAEEHPRFAFAFLLACLGLMGFPISYTFIGEDLIFSHIQKRQFILAFFNSLSFVIGGISIIRLYARLFLGTPLKSSHTSALPSQ